LRRRPLLQLHEDFVSGSRQGCRCIGAVLLICLISAGKLHKTAS
jgi:hypothetical protein